METTRFEFFGCAEMVENIVAVHPIYSKEILITIIQVISLCFYNPLSTQSITTEKIKVS